MVSRASLWNWESPHGDRLGAAVVTMRVAETEPGPLSVAGVGESQHAASEGAPLHASSPWR